MTTGRRIVGSARIVGALTLISRVLGLLRDMVCSYYFGAGGAWSAFSIAFAVPNLFRRLFGEGALSAAFIPTFSETYHQAGAQRAARLAGAVVGILLLILIGLTASGEGLVWLLKLLVPGDERGRLTLKLTAILLPYMILICTVAVLAGLLNVLSRFGAPAAAPVILNVSIIAGAWIGSRLTDVGAEYHVLIVAVAVIAGGLLQLALQLGAVRRARFPLALNLDHRQEGVSQITRMMAPMMLGLAAVQLNTLADSLVAYWLVDHEGAPAVLYYAQRLYQFPLAVFGLSLATAIFPQLSELASKRDMGGMARVLQYGLGLTLFVGIPCTLGLILVAGPLVELLYQRGQFRQADASRVSWALVFYATGIWAYGVQHIVVRGFYALRETTTPVRTATMMVALNLALNLTFVLLTPLEEAGLALATAICAAIQCALLAGKLGRRIGGLGWRGIAAGASRTMLASAVMVGAVLAADRLLGTWPTYESSAMLQTACIVVTGAGTFALAALALGIRGMGDILRPAATRPEESY